MSLPLRKLVDLAPRKPPVSAAAPFTPPDLRPLLPGFPGPGISGVGAKKLEAYGRQILRVLDTV